MIEFGAKRIVPKCYLITYLIKDLVFKFLRKLILCLLSRLWRSSTVAATIEVGDRVVVHLTNIAS